jgi:hypothetical protein
MGRKRKAQNSLEVIATPRKKKMEVDAISPSSKILIFKVDVFLCNGHQIGQDTELGAADIEEIWALTLNRSLEELAGYTSSKNKNKEIRIQYQLKNPMSIRDIAKEPEFTHEKSSVANTEIFKCRVVGLGEVRLAAIGETVRVTVAQPNFDLTPEQIIAWISKYGIVSNHRY